MTIENKVVGANLMPWATLRMMDFNNLKLADGRDVSKLKQAILEEGFIAPFFIWDGTDYVLDGAGRFLALQGLELDGFEIPELPYILIEAKDKETALKIVLQLSSQHGEVTQESVKAFTKGLISFDKLEKFLDNKTNFIFNSSIRNFEKEEESPAELDLDDVKSNEDREQKFKEQLVTCPHCDGKFNMQV